VIFRDLLGVALTGTKQVSRAIVNGMCARFDKVAKYALLITSLALIGFGGFGAYHAVYILSGPQATTQGTAENIENTNLAEAIFY